MPESIVWMLTGFIFGVVLGGLAMLLLLAYLVIREEKVR